MRLRKLRTQWLGYSRAAVRRRAEERIRINYGYARQLELEHIEYAANYSELQREQAALLHAIQSKREHLRQLQLRSAWDESASAAETLERPAPSPADHQPPPRLGDLLVQRSYITQKQLDQAIAYQDSFGGRLGDILIELGHITEAQIDEAIRQQPNKGRLGDLLVQQKLITKEQLNHALAFQQKSGGMLGDVILSLRYLDAETLYRAIATQYNVGRIGNDISYEVAKKIPESLARSFGAVVLREHANRFTVAVSGLLTEEQTQVLTGLLEKPIEQVLATPEEMEQFWSRVYESEMMKISTEKLAEEQPHNSANVTFTAPQIATLIVMGLIVISGLVYDALDTLILINIGVQIFYMVMTLFKFLIILYGARRGAQYRFEPEAVAALDERELPVYTILVPMYKESEVIPQLLSNLEKLDYPKAKLDVRLLIEQDDIDAQKLLKSMDLPPYYTVLVVPDSLPKTKPKACNFGLIRAKGEYIVIFDAEDRPDPDQLKKVILTFRNSAPEVACVQAKLNYFNSEQNLLTRWFTQEYSMWFELLLPGIMKLDIPIPLGGTSNHFKTQILKELDAWDPYNVTEDADLGIRLYKAGYKTAIVDSRTWEEANSRFGNWIRQRSRWIKGYMQTWLVHMRNPFRLWKELGPRGFLGFQVMVFATPVIPLLNPLFWLMIVLWYGWKMDFIPPFFPGPIYYMSAFELYVANFFFVYSNIVGVYWVIRDLEKRNQPIISHRLVKYAILTPLYWVMMSISAYKAAWQLITKPFYWEKTLHGLDTHTTGVGGDQSLDG